MSTATKLKDAKARSYVERKSRGQAETIAAILQNTITSSDSVSVYEFSTQHKVLGIFIKWFGCKITRQFN